MPMLNVLLASVPQPFTVSAGGTAATSLQAYAPVGLLWADGTAEAYTPGTPSAVASSAYGGNTVDSTQATYLLLAVKGAGHPVLVKQQDQGSIDTVLGGTPQWAVLGWLEGPLFRRSRQNDGAAGQLPSTALEGDVATFRSGTWSVTHIGPVGSVLASNGADPYYETLQQLINSIFPPGTLGDILYFDGTTWVVRHIGNAGQVLTAQGVPVWQDPVAPANFAMGVISDPSTKVSNSAGASGWQSAGFDDSGWAYAQAVACALPTVGLAGQNIWDASRQQFNGETVAARTSFIPPPGFIATAAVYFLGLTSLGVWINGNFVPGSTPGVGGGGADIAVNVNPQWIVPGQKNVVAMQVQAGAGGAGSCAWMNYRLNMFYGPPPTPGQAGGGLPAPIKGALLYSPDGATWADLAPGSTGQTLKMQSSGLPGWQ